MSENRFRFAVLVLLSLGVAALWRPSMPSARAADPAPFVATCMPIVRSMQYSDAKFALKVTETLAAMRATGPAHIQVVAGAYGQAVCGW